MSKDGAKEEIRKEYDDSYKKLVDSFVEKNSQSLKEKALQDLVKKHKQRLTNLSVVCLNSDSTDEPMLMYCLGDKNFLEYYSLDSACRFYVRKGCFKEFPLVREVEEKEWNVFEDSVLKYLTENEEGRKITVESKGEKNWVFECSYSTDDYYDDDDEFKETLFEVVMADDFEEATEKMLRKLLNSKTAVAFWDFNLWGNKGKGSVKISIIQKACKNIPFIASSVSRSSLQSNSNKFSFVIPLEQ